MVVTRRISLQTKGECDIIDITPQVEQQVAETDINNGTATLFVAGSTAGISTIEFESVCLLTSRVCGSEISLRTSPITMTAAGVMATDTLMSAPRC